jgi:hypothetical protein
MERNLEGVKVKRDVVTLPDAGPEVKCGCRALTSDEVRQYMMQGPGSPTLEQIASQEGNERRVGARQELSSRNASVPKAMLNGRHTLSLGSRTVNYRVAA